MDSCQPFLLMQQINGQGHVSPLNLKCVRETPKIAAWSNALSLKLETPLCWETVGFFFPGNLYGFVFSACIPCCLISLDGIVLVDPISIIPTSSNRLSSRWCTAPLKQWRLKRNTFTTVPLMDVEWPWFNAHWPWPSFLTTQKLVNPAPCCTEDRVLTRSSERTLLAFSSLAHCEVSPRYRSPARPQFYSLHLASS